MSIPTLTMKFGGTSVGSADAIQQVVAIVQSHHEKANTLPVVVVSAMSGVTDLLKTGIVESAAGDDGACNRIAARLRELHYDATNALLETDAASEVLDQIDVLINEYARFCQSVAVLGEVTPRVLDFTMGLGERMSSRLVAAALEQVGVRAQALDASDLIVTDDQFQNAAPLMTETTANITRLLVPLLEDGIIPVITGFIGATREGVGTTLGRGGSDYSAALIGAALDSEEVWIWTDVDGVMTADPRTIPEARTIARLTHREVSELAYFGAKVLHPRTIRPLLDASIPLWIKNTFNPQHPGTQIVAEGDSDDRPIKAVTAVPQTSLITIEGGGMLGVPGIAARAFGVVADHGTNVLLISQASSEQSICFVVPHNSAEAVTKALNAEFAQELQRRDIDQITARNDITIITAVGSQIRHRPGVAGPIFVATGEADVNVYAIAQGSSDCSLSIVVDSRDAERAMHKIHELIA